MDIELPQILFQIVNFGVVVGALSFLLYKPVKKMLEERSNRIEEAQKAAESTLLEKKSLDETKKRLLSEAEKDAQAIVDEAKKDAKRIEKDIIAQAKQVAAEEIEKEKKQLADEYKTTVKQLRQAFVTEVAAMTEKVLGEAVDEKVIAKKLDKDIDAVIAKI
ncbi:ATP synthase F0 subunit B [Patescibacteria group bacterium]|nr:ATP synthase F0 subunit B [Patescibacteria group bacterium]